MHAVTGEVGGEGPLGPLGHVLEPGGYGWSEFGPHCAATVAKVTARRRRERMTTLQNCKANQFASTVFKIVALGRHKFTGQRLK